MGLSLTVLDADHCFKAVVIYNFTSGQEVHDLAKQLQGICKTDYLLQQSYKKTHIFWEFKESILVPATHMPSASQQEMLNLVYGNAAATETHSDFLYKHNMHQVYRLPQPVAGVFSQCLPAATRTHVYAALLNTALPAGDHLFTVFYGNTILVMLAKEKQLQIIQQFNYSNPDDCVYHLLNVCKGFDVTAHSVTLHISGLIDEASALYAAIYKYFLHIHFDTLPKGYDCCAEIKAHPVHFFSHLFQLASCV